MKQVNTIVHLFLLTFFTFSVFGHPAVEPGPSLKLAYGQILNLQLNEGRSTLSQLTNENKDQPFYYYLENLLEIIEILLNENQASYEKYGRHEKNRIRKLESLPDNDPYKLYVISEIKLQWAFIKLKFGESFSAGWGIKQAYKLAQENYQKFPDFKPNYKTKGTLNILIGTVPQKYQWLLNLFGLKGSVSEGLELLSKIEGKNDLFSLEASILKCLSGVYILQENSLIKSFARVYADNPDNLLVKFAYAAVNFKGNRSEKALSIIEDSEKMGHGYARIHYFDYLKGKILLQKKSYMLASYYFDRFINRYQGVNNIKDAWFQLFLCYWLNDRPVKAREIYKMAKVKGSDVSTSDKYADRLLEQNEFPQVQIMQIRLATDGGYYDLATQEINNLSIDQLEGDKNKTELIYRKARLLHLQGQLSEAVRQYKEAISMTGKEPWYFAPSAALQLGHIHVELKKYDQAAGYFKSVLSFRNHPYKYSLDWQARSALKKLEILSN